MTEFGSELEFEESLSLLKRYGLDRLKPAGVREAKQANIAQSLGKNALGLFSRLTLPTETLPLISSLDLRPSHIVRFARKTSLPHRPERPFPGQLALAGLEELGYVDEIEVPAHLLYP